MKQEAKYIVEDGSSTKRLDVFVSAIAGVSRSQAKKLIQQGRVWLNGQKTTKVSSSLSVGDSVEIVAEQNDEQLLISNQIADIPVQIISDTDDYLVINKPAGYLVHSTQAGENNTLVHWLLARYSSLIGVGDNSERPGIVHRLDKDASGVLVVAKTKKMFDHLKKQFQSRAVEKTYLVLVHGVVETDQGVIDFPIDRGADGRMASRPKIDRLSVRKVRSAQPGKEAVTEFWVERRFVQYSLLRVNIHTGRTNQIRVHLFAYNHPVVGDKLYFNRKLVHARDKKFGRLWLHAAKLCFQDCKKKKVCFEADVPVELQSFLSNIV